MILDPAIFFKGDIIDLSFVCNNGQIGNLLSNVEEVLIDRLFEKVGEVENPANRTCECFKIFCICGNDDGNHE